LLEDELGVIDAVKLVDTKLVEEVDVLDVVVALTTCNTVPAVLLVKTVPVNAGKVSVLEPETAGACSVIVPLVSPAIIT